MSLLWHSTIKIMSYNSDIKEYCRFSRKIRDVPLNGLGELYIFLGVDTMKATLDKEKVKELYLEGLNSAEIAKKIGSNKEAVKKCIQRNFNHLKHDHEIAVIQRRENLKATNYEANKFMSNSAFIKKNRSIYKTNADGDITIDKKVAPVVTWDTPKRLANENKNNTIKHPLLEHWL